MLEESKVSTINGIINSSKEACSLRGKGGIGVISDALHTLVSKRSESHEMSIFLHRALAQQPELQQWAGSDRSSLGVRHV